MKIKIFNKLEILLKDNGFKEKEIYMHLIKMKILKKAVQRDLVHKITVKARFQISFHLKIFIKIKKMRIKMLNIKSIKIIKIKKVQMMKILMIDKLILIFFKLFI